MRMRRWGRLDRQTSKIVQIIEADAVSQPDNDAFKWVIIGDDDRVGAELGAPKAKGKGKGKDDQPTGAGGAGRAARGEEPAAD